MRAQESARPIERASPCSREDEHDMADALVVGCLLITLVRLSGLGLEGIVQ